MSCYGLSRRTQVLTPDNTLNYSFDPRGNLTAANDNDSGISFTYDNRNRLATTTTDGTVGPQPAVVLSQSFWLFPYRLYSAICLSKKLQAGFPI